MTLFLASAVRDFVRHATADTRPYLAAQSFLVAPPPAANNDQRRDQFRNQIRHWAIVAGVSTGLLALGPYKEDVDIALYMPKQAINKKTAAAKRCNAKGGNRSSAWAPPILDPDDPADRAFSLVSPTVNILLS